MVAVVDLPEGGESLVGERERLLGPAELPFALGEVQQSLRLEDLEIRERAPVGFEGLTTATKPPSSSAKRHTSSTGNSPSHHGTSTTSAPFRTAKRRIMP